MADGDVSRPEVFPAAKQSDFPRAFDQNTGRLFCSSDALGFSGDVRYWVNE
jgi:hypothetical protein